MEKRNIKIDDNVLTGDKIYKIVEIYNDDTIIISADENSVLQPDEFKNYYLNEDLLRFFPPFTYLPDADIDTLIRMDDDILNRLCVLDSYVSDLCKDKHLWIEKLKARYGEYIFEFVKDDFRLKYNLYKDYEIFSVEENQISKQNAVNLAAENGHLDILKWMHSVNMFLPDQQHLDIVSEHDSLVIIKWVYYKNGLLLSQNGVDNAASRGHLDILKWMNNKNGSLPSQYGVNITAKRGGLNNINVLKWVYSKEGPLPDEHMLGLGEDVSEWLRFVHLQNANKVDNLVIKWMNDNNYVLI